MTPQRRQALEKIVLHATSLRIPIVEVEGGTLTALAGFDGHQGVGLVVEARHYATPDEILARARERGEPPFVLVLDSLEDPQNVGTLLRSAEAAGVHGVLFPTKRQAPLSPAAVKASAGAVEHLLLAPVDDLAGALADLHIDGLRIVGAEAEAPLTARQADLRGPLALVVGSEGQGLGPAVRRRTDLLVRIPMRGAIGSLNASVAGSILLFEAVAQRDPGGTASAPAGAIEPARSKVAKGLTAAAAGEGAPSPEAEARESAVEATAAPTRKATTAKARPRPRRLPRPRSLPRPRPRRPRPRPRPKATTAKAAKATPQEAKGTVAKGHGREGHDYESHEPPRSRPPRRPRQRRPRPRRRRPRRHREPLPPRLPRPRRRRPRPRRPPSPNGELQPTRPTTSCFQADLRRAEKWPNMRPGTVRPTSATLLGRSTGRFVLNGRPRRA